MTILMKLKKEAELTAGEMRRYLRPMTLALCGLMLFLFGILLNISAETVGMNLRGASYELQKSLYPAFSD